VRIVSLFSGVGGLDIACERAFGGKTIVQVEREPFALRVLERRWPDVRRHDDVMTYRGEDCEVIAGGFPCTDLSVAGKREGLDAARSGLYHEMMRIVGEALPQYVVVENVPPLLQYRGRLDTDFARLGYGTIWQVCEASDVGAPHRRQRVFIVAVRGLAGSQMLPRPSPQVDLFLPGFDGRQGRMRAVGDPRPRLCTPGDEPSEPKTQP
jgi:DNA (cytosine-5)-methyltransferase 1